MTEDTRPAASSPLLVGVFMLIVGFGIGLEGISDSALYNASVSLFNLTMKVGGSAMLVVAALYWANVRVAWLLDAVCSLVIGVLMIGVAVVWLVHAEWLYGIVLVILSVMSINSARRIGACSAASVTHPSPEAKDEGPAKYGAPTVPVAPAMDKTPAADVHKVQQPAPEEPPPEGFLAELGQADDEPG